MDDKELLHSHPWEARFLVGLIIMILGFIGLVLTDLKQDMAWHYWRMLAIVNALLCLWLSWYTQRKQHVVTLSLFWKEILHWSGLILSVYLVTVLVDGVGIEGRFLGSLQIITLLALSTFLAGVYTEPTLMAIGILLGVFCLGISMFAQYLYSVLLPITVFAALILFWVVKRKRKRATDHIEHRD